jgi:glucose/mannose-6-phosphate isomerase
MTPVHTAREDFTSIEKKDKSGMLKLLVDFPLQCRRAKEIGTAFSIGRDYFSGCSQILFTGLGGSAIGADLIRSCLADEIRVPVFVNRNYTLPNFVSRETLVIASSYSGNTEETLSAYKDARAKGAKLIAITSGGELAKMARADGIPCVAIPEGLPPRCALGYSFFPSLVLLSKLGLVSDRGREIDGAIALMEALRDEKVGPDVPERNNLAKALAKKLFGRFPVIYGGRDHIDSVVVRWRGQLAENSKALSSAHVFPEMNHNEIVGWENPAKLLKKFVVVCLRDKGDHPRTKKRMDITKRIIEKEGVEVLEVESIGDSVLERMFSLICIGDFLSFYLAILYGVDPTPVERVTYLKKELAKES